MDCIQNDVSKLSKNMVMCGDHPSVTRTDLSPRDAKLDEKEERPKERIPAYYATISPTSSRTAPAPRSVRATSEQALRVTEARRRVRSLERVQRHELQRAAPSNRALLQAALGSFRWPPYLLCVWVLVLLVTHALHCLVGVLESSLPALKKCCQYFRTWTEDSWKQGEYNHRIYPMALASLAGILYTLYFALFLVYSIAVWFIEPLCDPEDKIDEPKITNYNDDSKSITEVTK